LFVYDPVRRVVYFHTAGKGRTKKTVMKTHESCFQYFACAGYWPVRMRWI
jgi:hypothetical protein